jgi:hypothetical protein
MFGDEVLKDEDAAPAEIASHPHPYYSPIAAFGSEYVLEPVAYGLMFAGSFTGGTLIQADLTSKLQAAGVNAAAYAARLADGKTSVIVLNKDTKNDLSLRLDFAVSKSGAVSIETLHAPSLESREAHITRAAKPERLQDGKVTVSVPHASGLRITLV